MRYFAKLTSVAVLLILASPALAATLYVPSEDYPTIQAGINGASSGDTVMVAAGTEIDSLVTDVPVEGDTADFPLEPNLTVTEIYEVVSQTSGPIDPSEYDWFSEPGLCAIFFMGFDYDGHLLDVSFHAMSVYAERPTVNVSIVLKGEDAERTKIWGNHASPLLTIAADDVLVEGFTIFDAGGDGDVFCVHIDSRSGITIRDNIIGDAGGWGNGYGVYAKSCPELMVTDNIVFNVDGWEKRHGIYAETCPAPVISGNTVRGTGGWGDAASIWLESCESALVYRNIIHDMGGWEAVSGVYANGDVDLTVKNNIIGNLGSWGDVSSIRVVGCTGSALHNNTLLDLFSDQTGTGIRVEDCAGTSISSNVLSGIDGHGIYVTGTSSPAISYNCLCGCGYVGCEPGVGDISSNPLFVDADADDNYDPSKDCHIQSTYGSYHDGLWLPDPNDSPCIDTGNPAFPYDNEPSDNGDRINMGAYGNTEQASLSGPASDAPSPDLVTTDLVTFSSGRPNPFAHRTVLEYGLPASGPVRLAIHDIGGRLVSVLAEGVKSPGVHSATWDGRNEQGLSVAGGVYFGRLEAGGVVLVRRIVLTR